MKEFDKKIRELAKDVKIPEEYNRRVEEVLCKIPELEDHTTIKRRNPYKRIAFAVACLVCVIGLLHISSNETEAGLFAEFKMTIMKFLNLDEEESDELGVESENTIIQSKPDLQIELRETVTDKNSIYLLIQITGSKEIEFDENIGFEYFAFCKGENYVSEKIVTGVKECQFVERIEERPNMATYVVSIMADEELIEDENITLYMKNLLRNPDTASPELLVEGMWSITFPVFYTVEEEIEVECRSDMEFPYVNTTAFVKELRITPLGMVLTTDISNFPREELGVTDTRLEIRMRMLDGTEHIMSTRDLDSMDYFATGDVVINEDGDKTYQTNNYMFGDTLDIRKIAGICIEDLYIPIE